MSQNVTTKESNGFRIESTLPTGILAIRNYEFTDTEMIVVSVISITII